MTTKPTIQRMISDAWHNFRHVEERSVAYMERDR